MTNKFKETENRELILADLIDEDNAFSKYAQETIMEVTTLQGFLNENITEVSV